MKKREEITQQDWELIKKHKAKTSYNNEEMSELFNLVRTYVDPRQATCVTCSSNLRDAKTKLNEFYQSVLPQIDSIFEAQAQVKSNDLQEAEKQVEDYIAEEPTNSESESKKRGRKKKE